MKNSNETFFAIFAQCGIYLILRPDSKYDNLFLHANGHAKLNLFFCTDKYRNCLFIRRRPKNAPCV